MKKSLLILLCALGLPIAMNAQQQERRASKMLDGMRAVNTVGKYNAPAKEEGEGDPSTVELVPPNNLNLVDIGNNWVKAEWLPVADESEWKLRIKQSLSAGTTAWGFDDGTTNGWTAIDSDEDGNNWYTMYGSDYTAFYFAGNGGIASQSYKSGALTPDNWIISPKVALGGTLSFYASGLGSPYEKEHFGVFVSTTDTELASFTQVGETTETTGTWINYSFDLSAYEGQEGYIAIRHFDCTDMNILLVDEITLSSGDPGETPETIIEPITEHPYTVTGLTAGTTYDLQVAAVRDGEVSDWSGTIRFKTSDVTGQMPVDVAVNEITDKTANVTWVGNNEDQFNIRYREYLEYPTFTWDFEEGIEGWTQIDADGDGNIWQHHINTGSGNLNVKSGVGSIFSESYKGSALTPDNWIVSPEVELGTSVSIWASAHDPNFPQEHFAVYVTTGDPANTDDFVEVIPETVTTKEMTEYTGDISEYTGQMGYIAIRHFNCSDQFKLVVDDVTIIYPREDGRTAEWKVEEYVTSPCNITGLTPEAEHEVQVQTVGNEEWTKSVYFTTLELQAEPAVTPTEVTEQEVGEDFATIGWTGNGETSWNIRYRKQAGTTLWDFETTYDDWNSIDADGDGFGWGFVNANGMKTHSGTGVAASVSYDNKSGKALTPDNWLISPEVTLDGTLSFWAVSQENTPVYVPEHFAVYATTGDPTNTANFTEILGETVVTAEMTEYTADLSIFEGQKGYLAFRHFNCTDLFQLNLDDIAITTPENEWIVVEGVTENPYTIEGLENGVTYEFEVQAIGEAGDVSEWSETMTFTTSMPDAIVEVASETTANNVWYNINGARLNGKPVQKGIYILNGKKVMVK
jgi:hypothetical protein